VFKIFLINGPAGSGKDTAANELAEYFSGRVAKFATPLKDAATAIYCGNDRAVFDSFDTFEMKKVPHERFFGKTCREVQIAISEQFLKLIHDDNVFGNILAQKIEDKRDQNFPVFVSDSGFRPEAEVLVRKFGPESIVLIRLHREGYTFEGDSRGYINLDDLGVKSFDVNNPEGDVKGFYSRLREVVAYTLGETK
jgi:hypothetical protein